VVGHFNITVPITGVYPGAFCVPNPFGALHGNQLGMSDIIAAAMTSGHRVELRGFGTFAVKQRSAHGSPPSLASPPPDATGAAWSASAARFSRLLSQAQEIGDDLLHLIVEQLGVRHSLQAAAADVPMCRGHERPHRIDIERLTLSDRFERRRRRAQQGEIKKRIRGSATISKSHLLTLAE
jgi:hypothetical protein